MVGAAGGFVGRAFWPKAGPVRSTLTRANNVAIVTQALRGLNHTCLRRIFTGLSLKRDSRTFPSA